VVDDYLAFQYSNAYTYAVATDLAAAYAYTVYSNAAADDAAAATTSAAYSSAQSTADLTDASAASAAYSSALVDDATAATSSGAYSTAQSTADLTDAAATSAAYSSAQSTADLTDASALSASYIQTVNDDLAASNAEAVRDAAIDAVITTPEATVANPFVIADYDALSDFSIEGITGFVGLTNGQMSVVSGLSDLDDVLTYLASLEDDNLVFEFDGNTYVYSDIGGNDELDNDDLLVILMDENNSGEVITDLNNVII
jgi:hypothetical protein